MIFLVLLFAVLSLQSCKSQQSYNDLYATYFDYVANNQSVYQDDIEYFNHVSMISLQSVVLVEKLVYNAPGSATGSGVIIDENTDYYYVLTNQHVVDSSTWPQINYIIGDYLGNQYQATLFAHSVDYDLAILKFMKSTTVLSPIPLAIRNVPVDQRIAILGYPYAQINAITLGKTLNYQFVEVDNSDGDEIGVLFPILITDAPVKSGSSGSLVVNNQFEMAGLVFAGSFIPGQESSLRSYVIPVEKIKEFILSSHLEEEVNS